MPTPKQVNRIKETTEDVSLLWCAMSERRPDVHLQDVRNRIFDIYYPFARMLAAKMFASRFQRELEFADFLQYATIGLLEAIDRFDPGVGTKFESFAVSRITGSILTGIESLSEMQVQISARKRIVKARLDSLASDGHASDDPESSFSYLAELAIGLAVGFALEGTGMHHSVEGAYEESPYTSLEVRQFKRRIRSLIDALPFNEMRVIQYHYLQELGFSEICQILGLSKGRISQLHRQALRRLSSGCGGADLINLQC